MSNKNKGTGDLLAWATLKFQEIVSDIAGSRMSQEFFLCCSPSHSFDFLYVGFTFRKGQLMRHKKWPPAAIGSEPGVSPSNGKIPKMTQCSPIHITFLSPNLWRGDEYSRVSTFRDIEMESILSEPHRLRMEGGVVLQRDVKKQKN